jgi:hypothetical protein
MGHSVALLILLSAGTVNAQTMTCAPARTDAPECRRFHYHVRAWQPRPRTFTEVAATPVYSTRSQCDAARAIAQKTSQTFAEQVTLSKVDGKFQADVLGNCHCDSTDDPASRSFLDDAARLRQRRALQDVAWQNREMLLDNSSPAAAQLLRSSMAPATTFDRFLGEKLPGNAPTVVSEVKPLALLDTLVGAAVPHPAIAGEIGLLTLDAPPVAPAGPLHATISAAVTPASRDNAGSAFLTYESARIAAVERASAVLSDSAMRNAIRLACDQRRQVLANLERVGTASDRDGRLVRAMELATNEGDHLALLRSLFGAEIAASWTAADAKEAVLRNSVDAREAQTILQESADDERRRVAVYFLLARYSVVPQEEVRALAAAINGLLPEGGKQ